MDIEARRGEERRSRIDRRRQLVEATERDKEDQRMAEEREKESQGAAAESLLLLHSCKVDVEIQTQSPVRKSVTTQFSGASEMYCFPPQTEALKTDGMKLLERNGDTTKFYTGLASWNLINHLVMFLCTINTSLVKSKLFPFDGLLLTLMLNLRLEDLAYRLNIGSLTASDTFNRYIDLIYIHLKFLITWPSQETCRANMPQV